MQGNNFSPTVRKTAGSLLHNRILLLFLLCMVVYNVNLHPIPNYDTVTARVLPWSMLATGSLSLDAFVDSPAFKMQTAYVEPYGHYLTVAPITLPVLITPLYVVPSVIIGILGIPVSLADPRFVILSLAAEKVVASLLTSLSVVVLYLVLQRFVTERYALWGALLYAFATSTWAISSQALWQHTMAELLLCCLLLLLLHTDESGSPSGYALLGISGALFFMNRQADAIFLLPVLYWVLRRKDLRMAGIFFASFCLAATPFILYNLVYFGSLFGGYRVNAAVLTVTPTIIPAFAAYLVSPNRGLFFFSPVILFALPGIWLVWKNIPALNPSIRAVLLLFAACVPVNILVYCSFPAWWGGESFGYRYLVDALPVLAVFLAFALEYLWMHRSSFRPALKVVFIFLVAWSVLVQACGAFYYYYDWDMKSSEHASVNDDPARVWDFSDLQIFYGVTMNPNPYSLLLDKFAAQRGASFSVNTAS